MLDVKKFYIYLLRSHEDTKYLCDELAQIITKIRFQVINSLKDVIEQGFRYEKDCLSKKEETTCIGNGNSGRNPNQKHNNLKCCRNYSTITIVFSVGYGEYKVFFLTPVRICR